MLPSRKSYPRGGVSRGPPVYQASLIVRIVLSEDEEGMGKAGSSQVHGCGDKISGHLEIVASHDFHFEVTVSFEGHIKTWVNAEPDNGNFTTASFQFLKQKQHLLKTFGTRYFQENLHIYCLPFQFVVPNELISAHADANPQFLSLCPSTNIASTIHDPKRAYGSKQPLIEYFIQVSRVRTSPNSGISILGRYDQRRINILPYTPASPPLQINEFPHEYRLRTVTTLRQHPWSRPLGRLQITAVEPSPINLLTPTPRATSILPVELRYTPEILDNAKALSPLNLPSTFQYHLRSHTFYSSRKLDRYPTLLGSKTDACLRVHERQSPWEIRDFGVLSWTEEARTGSKLNVSKVHDDEEPEDVSWLATVDVPLNVSKMQHATFLNVLSARRYSIVLRMKIGGVHQNLLELILPVQLIYYPQEGLSVLTGENDRPCSDGGISYTWSDEEEHPPSYDID